MMISNCEGYASRDKQANLQAQDVLPDTMEINPNALIYMKDPKRLQSAASKPMVYMINPKRLQTAALHH